MRSLFLKIFLWFWISIVLISLTMVLIATIAQSTSDNAAWQNQAIVASEAAHAVDIYEREGADALRKHFEHLPKRPLYVYLLDEHGQEVLGQKLPQQAIQMVPKGFLPSLLTGPGGKIESNGTMASVPVPLKEQPGQRVRVYQLAAPPNFDRDTSLRQVVATQVVGPSGRHYTFLVVVPPFSIKAFLTSVRLDLVAKLGASLLLVGLFCYWLARHITAPVVQLREAASQIAGGQLSTRVSPAMHHRKDEIGVLGQHFDRMAERIESLVAGQQRLLSTVSHELRSPLTRLSLAAGLLRQCPREEMQEYLDRIELETEQLDKLIAQLLTLSKIESRTETGSPRERIDLAALIQEIAVNGNFEARARSCSVFVGPVEGCATTGVVDQIRRAIENVVRNAIRYTRTNSQVEITLRRREGLSTPTSLIQVRDYGPGVPESDLEKIFLPFYRVHSERESHPDGSGLGLAITERIVRLHGGTVRAANAPGGGLLVDLELPLSA
jgi:two-component system sensor histidine kinase CpxA